MATTENFEVRRIQRGFWTKATAQLAQAGSQFWTNVTNYCSCN